MKIIKRGPDDKKMDIVSFVLITGVIFYGSYWIISDVFTQNIPSEDMILVEGVVIQKNYDIRNRQLKIILDNNKKIIYEFISGNEKLNKKIETGMHVKCKVVKANARNRYFGFEAIIEGDELYSLDDYKANKKDGYFYAPFLLILFLVIWFFCILLPGLGYKAVFDENVPDELKKKDNEAKTPAD